MKAKRNFYFCIFLLLLIIIILLWIVKPLTFFSKKQFSSNAKYVLLTMETNKKIIRYKDQYGSFPISLNAIMHLKSDSLEKIFNYRNFGNDYLLTTLIPISDSILLISKDTLRKKPFNE